MNYLNKDKKNNTSFLQKKRVNSNQGLKSPLSKIVLREKGKPKKIKKSLQYILVLKKYKNIIDYKNISLLTAFLTKYGKIRARRKTRIPIQKQRLIARAIRKARAFKLIPFTCNVEI